MIITPKVKEIIKNLQNTEVALYYYYIEISSNSDHFLNIIYLISLKPEGGGSVNFLKFQLCNHIFGL
jgi:hypothetical protein